MTLFDELFLQAEVILDDAVVHDDDLAGAVAMGMGVFLGGAAVGSPSGVPDTIATLKRLQADDFFQVAQLPFRATDLQLVPIAGDGDSSRVISAVLEPPQTLDNDRNDLLLADISNNATHAGYSKESVCEGAAKLFYYRVGEHFTSDALDFGLRLLTAESAVERKFEILSLTDFFEALVAHLLESTMDGLALRIEDAFFERNVNVGSHGDKAIIRQEDCGPTQVRERR